MRDFIGIVKSALVEPLEEEVAPSSYLYHGTAPDIAVEILLSNVMLDKTDHTDSKLITTNDGWNKRVDLPFKKKTIDKHGRVTGVSMSRSSEFPTSWTMGYGVILVFDRNKVAADNRIVPVAYYNREAGRRDEMEDFVVGPIRNVNRKLVAIEVSQNVYEQMVSDDEYMDEGEKLYEPILKFYNLIIKN